MQQVEMSVGANASKYWAYIRFEDKEGVVHERRVNQEHSATVNSNYLQAMIDGYQKLIKPCMVTVFCESDHIVACFQQGWVNNWEAHDWKNAKGNTVKNAEQWKTLRGVMAQHSSRVVHIKGDR